MNASTISYLGGIGQLLSASSGAIMSNNSQRRKSKRINGVRMAIGRQIKWPETVKISALSMSRTMPMECTMNFQMLRPIRVAAKMANQLTPSAKICPPAVSMRAEQVSKWPQLGAVIITDALPKLGIRRPPNSIAMRINYVMKASMMSSTRVESQLMTITFRFYGVEDPEHGRKFEHFNSFGLNLVCILATQPIHCMRTDLLFTLTETPNWKCNFYLSFRRCEGFLNSITHWNWHRFTENFASIPFGVPFK